jgi:hypothetical protein
VVSKYRQAGTDARASQEAARCHAEITHEMIDAGIDVLLQHCPDTATGDAVDRLMVAEIYKAIAGQAPASADLCRAV